MRSELFYTDAHQRVERETLLLLSQAPTLLSTHTLESPRAVGDAVQAFLGVHFEQALGNLASRYQADFARRAMADIAFEGSDGMYYIVDVKTRRHNTRFNMPNLTSVERLARLYEDDRNVFALLLVDYAIAGTLLHSEQVRFFPIEFISWECLTIGALGWGQIQIANVSHLVVQMQSRRTWMLTLCERLLQFYPREIDKIVQRMAHFKEVQQAWVAREDTWG
ncbi:MAG: hypothetical protein RML95_01640 [Anaerolineae bacterium]|nr:hypothetical protein [Anaerolineae bacterium]MDW8298017.1 hypothetical protein [Anaerolineae bacterium]